MMENYVKIPNLPENNISLAIVDGRIPSDIERELYKMNIRLIKTKKVQSLYEAISYHPDIMVHHLGGKDIIVAPNIDNSLVYQLENEGFNIIIGKSILYTKYPYDIYYNAARIGKYLVCNERFTDEILLHEIYKRGVKVINVKQGYSKCSICIVDSNSVITFDKGIKKELDKYNINTLLITPGHIKLFNLNYGFIGGSCGNLSKDKIAFFGNLKLHPDHEEIYSFVKKYGRKVINLSENIIIDLGTLIPLKEYSILMQ
ncbi:DUF6873 family GME fold protein [Caloramator sp. E03]|uniref:DUF6873 family GME fold protein n=1 Tax=Caloramator sp. E03 TaxID=2576307 RepID=UPI001FA986F6|nr:hypothetical protein [Caloramator sp. E03]